MILRAYLARLAVERLLVAWAGHVSPAEGHA